LEQLAEVEVSPSQSGVELFSKYSNLGLYMKTERHRRTTCCSKTALSERHIAR